MTTTTLDQAPLLAATDAASADRRRVRPLPYSHATHQAAHQFLVEEADALEQCDFPRWLDMLSPAVSYQVPLTTTVSRGVRNHKAGQMDHFKEDLYSLKMRIDRLSTTSAWAEDPASRTQRFVTNVRTFEHEDTHGSIRVESHFLIVRSRGDLQPADILAGVKHDELSRSSAGELRLERRVASLVESVLRTQNLAIFL
ncbi:3-phenylpropionate/cinnamic acid dioxygenase subunit beta [soil metagenome]